MFGIVEVAVRRVDELVMLESDGVDLVRIGVGARHCATTALACIKRGR